METWEIITSEEVKVTETGVETTAVAITLALTGVETITEETLTEAIGGATIKHRDKDKVIIGAEITVAEITVAETEAVMIG